MTEDNTSADGADDVTIDPWGSATIADYRSLFEQFGIEEFEDILARVPNPHYLMRRAIIFGHRDYAKLVEAMREDEPFAALSGFMPTGDPHIGHKLVFDELIWHQQQGGDTYGLIADLEAHSARGMTWDAINEHARDYLLSLLAFGFDPEDGTLYRQSTNRDVQDLAFELGIEANFSELDAIYGFDGETDVSHMQSVVTQMADILYPQMDSPKPTVIPVGPDQDPHIRLARDLARRMRYFGVTTAYASFELDPAEREVMASLYEQAETQSTNSSLRCGDLADLSRELRESGETIDSPEVHRALEETLENAGQEPVRPRVRFLDRNATPAAFEALIDAVEGEKRVYDAHVDAFDLSLEAAESLAREVEVAEGGFGFIMPSSIYHRFMTGLTGGKMSSSVPASHISLLDDPKDGYEKVKAATTGGRETAAQQRELGGEPDQCPVYELYAYLLTGDDDEYTQRVYDECSGGDRLCGACKTEAAELMKTFLTEHQEKREEMIPVLENLEVEIEPDRT